MGGVEQMFPNPSSPVFSYSGRLPEGSLAATPNAIVLRFGRGEGLDASPREGIYLAFPGTKGFPNEGTRKKVGDVLELPHHPFPEYRN